MKIAIALVCFLVWLALVAQPSEGAPFVPRATSTPLADVTQGPTLPPLATPASYPAPSYPAPPKKRRAQPTPTPRGPYWFIGY